MEYLKTVLVANRGEIACRLIKAAQKSGIRTIAIYTQPDCESEHVRLADRSVLLQGQARVAYIDGDQIIQVAKDNGAQAIIPGYGFLSENTNFARSASAAGLVFVGPSPEAIESFGLKHTARELAVAAGVPVVPGTQGLLEDEEAAAAAASRLGYPVMLKATAGGGGMGLLTCANEAEVRENFRTVISRASSLFKNAGVFLERYYPDSHHIEVQVFGNGQGKAISVGERECSIQRRHQKVIEECPSPFISNRYPDLRQKLTQCAVRLAEDIKYGSAGTVEYLVDDHTGDFFFLEMNTRLQVEHGITEMCYNVDLVELMLRQADRELGGKGGLTIEEMETLQARCLEPQGHAIEARVYAENPARNYAPSPGLLQQVSWHKPEGARIDTWVRGGIVVSAEYDPLLAKVMYHGPTREAAVTGMEEILSKSSICGPPINLGFLLAIIQSEDFRKGNTITKFLDTFQYTPAAIDITSGGSYTLVQDFPGRPTVGHGFGHAGPMDPIAFQVANLLVGNEVGTEALEITLTGPELFFLGDAVISLCGPPIPAEVDGKEMPQWTRVRIYAGQRLKIGKMAANCRVYLAIYGGLLNVSKWFGSKSTNPMVNVGGYQGRPLRAGDFLSIVEASHLPEDVSLSIPQNLRPQYTSDWTIQIMPGPYETGYLSPKDIEMFFAETWTISHNAARGGIRLIGPRPEFGRSDGGEGGAHPSNVIEYGYPLGGLNWTGDEPVIFPVDCPDFGGFICSLTVIKGDMWKLGQLRAGDKIKFHRVSLESALKCRRKNAKFLEDVAVSIKTGSWEMIEGFDSISVGPEVTEPGQDVLKVLEETDKRPTVTYRAGADDYILVDYGNGCSDLNFKCRATALSRELQNRSGLLSANRNSGGAIFNMVGCGNSLAICYDGFALPRADLLNELVAIEDTLGDMRSAKFPNRHFKLPLTFRHKKLEDAMERYMANQRSMASYLPDPLAFVAENNGMTIEELKTMFLTLQSVIIGVGFFMALPQSMPTDPRYRIRSPKMNPSRTYTPEGTVSWGGSAIAIYPVDCPGGYMPTGMTIPGLDIYGSKPGFSEERPWLFQDMDTISFYEVDEKEYDLKVAEFKAGKYEFEMEPGFFDMAEHNELLQNTMDEARAIQEKRAVSQKKMAEKEKALLEQWLAEKQADGSSMDEIKSMLEDPAYQVIEAPVNANVWKVLVQEGDELQAGKIVSILEAMKMEINVLADAHLAGATVAKVLVKPGDSIESVQTMPRMPRKSSSIPRTHFLARQIDPSSLETTHVSGPVGFLNPTRVHLKPAPESKEKEEEEKPAAQPVSEEEQPKEVKPRRQPRIEFLWRSRDNRKGRHAVHVQYSPKHHGPGHNLPPSTNTFQEVVRGLVRMVTYFPYWDVSWLVATIFTLGSGIWVINAFFVWLPLQDPSTEFSGESLVGGGVTAFIGATIFEIGSVLLLLEAVNEKHTACFGWAVGTVVKRLESHEDLTNTTEVKRISSDECGHHHSKKRSLLRDGLREVSPEEQRSFEWLPSLTELRTHYFHELGFLASLVQMIGATIFWIAGYTGLPGISDHMSEGLTDGVYWVPQIVGGFCFVLSGLLFTIETQPKWYIPTPSILGWHIGAWNLIGGIGFTLCGALGPASASSGVEYQTCLATFWGSWAFLIGSVIQWYESLDKFPVETKTPSSSEIAADETKV